tara:strand:+ start:119 stop:694 length:576 start_codon:yes stop_codon:yes gene_type:complete
MGLKQDLIDAKVRAALETGMDETVLDTDDGSFIEREAEYVKEAIVTFLTEAEFRITQLNAPIVLENFKIPTQNVDVKRQTITDEKKPTFRTIRELGSLIPGAAGPVNLLVDKVEIETAGVANRIGKEGALLPSIDISKDGRLGKEGGLISNGYVFIGEDPDSQEQFNVDDEQGQKEYTTVKLFREDIEELL